MWMKVLEITDPAQLVDFSVCAVIGKPEFEHVMHLLGLMWLYDGEPSVDKPHAELASGKHSNGFLDVGTAVKEHPDFRSVLAHHIVKDVVACRVSIIDGVFGAPTSSTALAGDIAEILGIAHYVLEKVGNNIIWSPGQDPVPAGARLLRAEELMTTASSCLKAMAAIIAGNPGWEPNFYPAVFTIVDRHDPREGDIDIQGSGVVSLFRYMISNFDPEECPYCAAGSKALKPKEHREIFFPAH